MDTDQVLNTKGVDAAGCPYTGGRNDESHAWQRIYSSTAADTQSGDGVSGAAPSGHPRSIALAPAWPNPARGYIVLQFRLPARGPVHLGMYDVAGRLVRTCVDHVLEPGEYRKGVDLAGVEAGVYFCELRAPGGGARRSFVVTR